MKTPMPEYPGDLIRDTLREQIERHGPVHDELAIDLTAHRLVSDPHDAAALADAAEQVRRHVERGR